MTVNTWSPSSIVTASKDQVSCKLGADAAILHLGTGVYYSLNPVGVRVWTLVQQPIPLQQLRETLLSEFDVAPERLERDLLELLNHLSSQKLIDVQDGTGP